MFRRLRSARGMSAAEAAIVLSTVSILAAAAAPAIGDYISEARLARARDEVRAIGSAVTRLSGDILSRGEMPGGLSTLQLLVGPGDPPTVANGVDSRWAMANGNGVGLFDDHMMSNTIGYPKPGPELPVGIKGWQGPYLDRPLGADPWGRRYAVRFGHGQVATIVLSAGPDGIVQTADGPNGLLPGGDDVISVMSGR